jgi:hypothetical protein
MEFKGVWNAATNTPTLVDGTGNAGDVYLCNVAGTVNFGAGPIAFAVGDYAVYTGTVWARSSGATGTVTSVGLSRSGDALTVTGSPITTSGTINIGFAGTNLQYINGAGNLVTFPTIATEAQRLITEVYNETGATLAKGSIVYINGGHGNLPTVTKAIATGDATSAQTYGIVQNDIGNNNNGFVVVIGSLTDLDTQAYPEGTQLYLSGTTAGAWTSTKPYAPVHLVYVAIVTRSHPTQGVVEVSIQNGYEMDELHNVAAQNPDNNDILQYKTSTSLWTKVAGTTSNIAEGSNLYFTNARARQSISLTTTGSTGAATYDNSTGVLNIPNYVDQYVGTVTSVGLSAPTGFSVTGSPVTSSGTLALSFASGYSLPTNVKQSNWDDAYTWVAAFPTQTGNSGKFLTTDGSSLSWATVIAGVQSVTASSPLFSSGGANPNITIQVANTSQNGYLSSTDWNTFNSKQNALTNPVTGTGSSGYVSFWDSSSSITGESNLFWDATNNRLGIGTNSPLAFLDITVLSTGARRLLVNYADSIVTIKSANDANNGETLRIVGDNINFNTGSSENGTQRMTITSAGNVGIGVTPTATAGVTELAIGSSATNPRLSGIRDGVDAFYLYSDSGGTLLNERRNLDLKLGTNNTTRLTISNTGAATFTSTLGVGGSVDTYQQMTVTASTAYTVFGLYNTTSSVNYRNWALATNDISGGDFSIRQSGAAGGNPFAGGSNVRLYIAPSGNVGIGTSTPTALLETRVAGESPATGRVALIAATSNGINDIFRWYDGVTQLGVFKNSGNVLIGDTTSPTDSKLYVKGSVAQNGISIRSGGNGGTYLFRVSWANGTEGSSLLINDNEQTLLGTTSGVSGGGRLQVNGNVNINGVFQINGVTIGGGGGSGVTGSGTTNYLTKWTGSTTLGNGTITDNGSTVTVLGGATLQINRTDNARGLQLYTTNDECVINSWEASSEPLHIRSNGTGGRIQFFTAAAERLRITNAGNIGIGTTTPSQQLETTARFVIGNAVTGRVGVFGQNTATADTYITLQNTAGNFDWGTSAGGHYFYGLGSLPIQFYTNASERMRISSGGNILISTTSDNGYKLQINGSASFAYGFLSVYRGSSSPNDILVGNSGSVFYIGGNTQVAGSVSASGGFFDTSDARLKNLVEDNYLLSSIANVKAKLYIKDGRKELGYYAQDLEAILPSAVKEGADGFLSLSYAQVHTAKIAVIEDEVTILKNRVSELEKQLNLN